MASALDPELSCPICLELFTDPVALPCMHSYCRDCLTSIVTSNVKEGGGVGCSTQDRALDGDHTGRVVQCPECRYIAVLDDGGLAKLPRNFSLANIVAKYSKKVSNENIVPCDICEEKPPANATKSCVQCKVSYCGQCLFFHPKKGILAQHKLVVPQEFIDDRKRREAQQKFCLSCYRITKKDEDHSSHSSEVVDVQTAKLTIVADLEIHYTFLEEKKKEMLKVICDTEEALAERQVMRKEFQKKIRKEALERNEYINARLEAIHSGVSEQTVQAHSVVRRMTSALLDLRKVLLADHRDVQLEEMVDLIDRARELQTITSPDINVEPLDDPCGGYTEVPIRPTGAKDKAKSDEQPSAKTLTCNCNGAVPSDTPSAVHQTPNNSVTSRAAEKLRPTPVSREPSSAQSDNKVEIIECKAVARKFQQGASIFVKWRAMKPDDKYKVKFLTYIDGYYEDNKASYVCMKGLKNTTYTEDHLMHEKLYRVTVSVVGKPESESEAVMVRTPVAVFCKAFQFSPIRNCRDIQIHWSGKECRNVTDKPWHESSLRLMNGVVGTERLLYNTIYWEVEVSFNARSFMSDYICCMGLCAEDKVDAVFDLTKNYNFFGITLGRGKNGQPLLRAVQRGKFSNFTVRPSSKAGNRKNINRIDIGYLFNTEKGELVVIDKESGRVCFVTETIHELYLQEGIFIPAFYIDPAYQNEVRFSLRTGTSIWEIPKCVVDFLSYEQEM